jgi:MmeI, target recognition domain
MCIAATSRTIAFAWINTGIVFSHALYVFASDKDDLFGTLMSEIGRAWALRRCSSMKQDFRYTNSDGFETLPLPEASPELRSTAHEYSAYRKTIMLQRRAGLTPTYDLLNDADEDAEDIQCLRGLHVEMDRAVARAYGWDDVDLGHGFHETRQGVRFTISEAARQEVLDRLLALNHERYAEEVEEGLHEKGAKKARRGRKLKPPAVGSRGTQPDLGFEFQLTPPGGARR